MMEKDKKQNHTITINKLLRRWLMLENETCINILGGIGGMFVFFAIIMVFSPILKNALITLGIGIVFFCALYVICLSRIALYFSKIGKQMLQYGTITEIKKKIEESVLRSIYLNGEEIITPEFIFIIQSNKGKKNYIQMIPLGEIREVRIGRITRYCNEFNEIFFRTYEEKEFSIRVYLNYEESKQLANNITSLCKDKIGYISKKKRTIKKERRTIKEEKSIFPFKEKINNTYSYALQQSKYYTAQKHILQKYHKIWILFAIGMQILIILMILLIVLFSYNQNLEVFLKEEWQYMWYSKEFFYIILLLIILAFLLYGVPMLMITCARIQFKKSIQRYEMLSYPIKEEIENQIIEPKSVEPLIFTEKYICFKDNKKMGFYNLVLYSDMVSCYPRIHGFSLSHSQTGTVVIMPITEFIMVFFAKDKKKYTIRFGEQEGLFWHCYKVMQKKAPHVTYGYQKKRR